MTLRSEIVPYIDGNDLVAPNPVVPGTMRASDNGVCFTSEYYIYLKLNGEIKNSREETLVCAEYGGKIIECMEVAGLVSRAPKDKGLQPPDDHLAIAAACSQLDHPSIAEDIFEYGMKNLGCYDNEYPNGPWRKEAFLWRQPQLIAAMYGAARKSRLNPISWLLNSYAAICILIGNIKDPIELVDGRRLTFLLISAMMPVSFTCRLAAKRWAKRQEKTYGPNFMSKICGYYYKGDGVNPHPFTRYAKYVAV